MRFICNVELAEDSVAIPETDYLVTGVLGFAGHGGLQLVSTRAQEVQRLYPSASSNIRRYSRYKDCAAPPDASRMSLGGLAIAPQGSRRHLLYAANTGDRKSIEVFSLTVALRSTPQLQWVGCVLLPQNSNPNAVAALKGFGMAIVSMDDDGPHRWNHHVGGVPTGTIYEWHPRSGLKTLPDVPLRGGNGIAARKDERWLYVSAWAGSELVVIDRDGKLASKRIPLPFLPDNLRWARDGKLWVVGQRTEVKQIAQCTGNPCMADWLIAKMDLNDFSVKVIVEARGSAVVNYATGVTETGDTLYITNRGMNRLGVVSIAPDPTNTTIRVDALPLP
jgi:DNA-binding beta-propeller fold protein YncE